LEAPEYCGLLNKIVTCTIESGEVQVIRGIPKPIFVWKIITLKLKRAAKKGGQLFAIQVDDHSTNKVGNFVDELDII